MAVLAQQGVGILASSVLALVLTKVPHQEVGLLLVIGPSEQALHCQKGAGNMRRKEKKVEEQEEKKMQRELLCPGAS